MFPSRNVLAAAGLAVVAFSVQGCSTVTCGDGTVLEGERCVPESLATCGVDTTLVDGECVPAATTCEAGTRFVDGKCTREGLSCGPGTEEIDGECLVLDPLRAVTVAAAAEPDTTPGRFKEFELPAVGAPAAVLGGVIDAPTNGQADLDVFQFAGQRLQRLRIEAQGVGLPVAGIVLQPADLTATFARFALTSDSRGGVREVVLPFAGDWIIIVSEQSNLTGGVPMGGAAFSYVVKVTQVEPKAPRALGADRALRGFHEDLDTFTVTPDAASGNLFDFVLDEPPADDGWPGSRAIWVSGPDGTLLADVQDDPPYAVIAPIRLALPAGTTVACVDYVYKLGREPAQYTFALEKVPVTALGTISSPVEEEGDALPKGNQVFSLNVTSAALVRLEAAPVAGSQLLPAIELRNAKYELVATQNATTLSRYFGPAETGTYFVVVRDRTFNASKTNLDFTFRARVDPVVFLGPVAVDATSNATGTIDAQGESWLALVAGNDGEFGVTVTPDGAADDLAADLRSVDTKAVVTSSSSGGPGAAEMLAPVTLLAGNTLLLKVTGPAGATFAASAIGAAMRAILETEPNDDPSEAQVLTPDPVDGALVIATFATTSDSDFYAVTLTAASRIVVETKAGIFGTVIDTRAAIVNAAGTTLASNDDFGGTDLSKLDYAASAGTYYIRIQRWSFGATAGDYRLQVDVVP